MLQILNASQSSGTYGDLGVGIGRIARGVKSLNDEVTAYEIE